MAKSDPRVIIFTCNWNAHESLQEAGRQHLNFPAGARPLKVDCLGQVGASTILKAFEKAPTGCCWSAALLTNATTSSAAGGQRSYLRTSAGWPASRFLEEQLQFHQLHTGQATVLVEAVQAFVEQLAAQQQE